MWWAMVAAASAVPGDPQPCGPYAGAYELGLTPGKVARWVRPDLVARAVVAPSFQSAWMVSVVAPTDGEAYAEVVVGRERATRRALPAGAADRIGAMWGELIARTGYPPVPAPVNFDGETWFFTRYQPTLGMVCGQAWSPDVVGGSAGRVAAAAQVIARWVQRTATDEELARAIE